MVRVQSGALQGHVYRHSRTARPLPGGRLRQINDGKPAPLRREAGHRTRLTDSPRVFSFCLIGQSKDKSISLSIPVGSINQPYAIASPLDHFHSLGIVCGDVSRSAQSLYCN